MFHHDVSYERCSLWVKHEWHPMNIDEMRGEYWWLENSRFDESLTDIHPKLWDPLPLPPKTIILLLFQWIFPINIRQWERGGGGISYDSILTPHGHTSHSMTDPIEGERMESDGPTHHLPNSMIPHSLILIYLSIYQLVGGHTCEGADLSLGWDHDRMMMREMMSWVWVSKGEKEISMNHHDEECFSHFTSLSSPYPSFTIVMITWILNGWLVDRWWFFFCIRFSITGVVSPHEVTEKGGEGVMMRGDVILLTKPLGSGEREEERRSGNRNHLWVMIWWPISDYLHGDGVLIHHIARDNLSDDEDEYPKISWINTP